MDKPNRPGPTAGRPKPPRAPKKAAPGGNPRIERQTRKILGKHYAAKYRAR